MTPNIQIGRFGGDERTLVNFSDNIQYSLDVMQKEGITNLAINSAWGWFSMNKNIDFLADNPWIDGVMIVDNGMDLTPVNALPHLKRLVLADKYTGMLDFNSFPQLKILFCRWNKKQMKNLDRATSLEWLQISFFNDIDLSLFKEFSQLKRFGTWYSRIQSLHGIENWSSLERLVLLKLSKLTDITGLEALAGHLKDIGIEGCKLLSDYSVLPKLRALESIGLGDGPPIDSVSFLEDKPVTSGFIGLEVLDKKLEVLDKKGIGYWKYKSYKN